MIVFLDTNVFIAAKYRFASKYFGSLRSLISNGDIQVIYTSATRGEVEHHIREDIKAEVEQYNRMLRKDLPLLTSFSKDTLSEVSVEDLSQAIIAGLNDFLSLAGVNQIPLNPLDAEQLMADYLFRFLELHGFPVDNANKNPSRLSRMPGALRDGVMQELIATNIGRHTWSEWLEYAEELALLPEPVRLSDIEVPPPKPPELIRGILRRGHKMLIAGPSKAGKSFLLIELAIAIAEGSEWLGFSCVQGKVLYVNLEIDPASCIDRFVTIYGRLGFTPPHTENIVIWNLRGHALPLDKLVPILVRRMKDEQFAAVIIDPIYKVITGDENNASDMGAFCNQFDKICTEMGASAIYCHHHSKGAQGGKKAMDRASGSGVFARDPDAQLDIIELKKPLFKETEAETEDGEVIEIEQFDTTRSAWRLEASLREFPPITPVNFYFDYPLHPVDTEGVLATYQPEGSSIGNLGLSSRKSTPEKRKLRLDEAYEAAAAEGMVTVKSMAEIAELSVETIRRYLKEFRDDYIVKNGVVQERPPMDNSTAQNMTV